MAPASRYAPPRPSAQSAGVFGMAVGVVAAGAAAGLAVERVAVHRSFGRRTDPYRDEPFGALRGAPYPVVATDGLALHVEIDEPARDLSADGDLPGGAARGDAAVAGGAPGSGGGGVSGGVGRTEGLTVVFCHGYALNLDAWHFQRRDLRETARLVFWDQRSHGRSGRSDLGAATLEQTGRDLGRVIDEVAPAGQLVLIGHSMGGMTIMSLAEQRPELFAERVAGVAFLASSAAGVREPPPGLRGLPGKLVNRVTPGVVAALGRRAHLVDRSRQAGSDLAFALTRRYSFASNVPDSYVEWTSNMIDATPIDVVAEFFPDFDRHDRLGALAALRHVAALVLVGREDRIVPLRHSEAIAEALPDAEFEVLEHCGHMLMVEHHDTVTDALRRLLKRVA